jgi:hypothetical protein
MDKTIAERIADAKDELRKMENRRKRLIQSQKVEIRRQRTRRLIERGAIVESLIDGADKVTNKQFKSLMGKILTTEQVQRAIAETKAGNDDKTVETRGRPEERGNGSPASKQTGAANGDGTAGGEPCDDGTIL